MSAPLQIGLVLFPRVTQLDFTGPLQVLKPARREGASDLEADRAGRQRLGADADADRHLGGLPAARRDLRPRGVGTDDMAVNDEEMLDFLRRQAKEPSTYSVCTGSLCWGCRSAAGLPATTHWSRWIILPIGRERRQDAGVRRPQPRTGGGVTAGIDFALTLVSLLVGPPDRGGDTSSGSNTIPRRRSTPARRHRAAGSSGVDERRRLAPFQQRRGRGDRTRRRAASQHKT